MKKLTILIIVLLLAQVAFADVIQIPFECYPNKIQKKFKQYGFKVDLNGSERTEDSWGFINNKGTSFDLITYKPTTVEELEIIKYVIMGN